MDTEPHAVWQQACEKIGLSTSTTIGDPAAVVAMLEWLAAEIDVPTRDDDTGEIVQVPDRRGLPELWFGDDYHWHCRPWGYCETAKHRLLALALASAVLAVPQETQP